MKKYFIYIFAAISLFNIFSADNIVIGISLPFLRNESSSTMFYNKQFAFEMLFKNESEIFTLEIVNVEEPDDKIESVYIKSSKDNTINNTFDYLLYSSVYSNDHFLFFKVQLINPYNNDVVFMKMFVKKIDYTIGETITECSDEILEMIKNSDLTKIKNKNAFKVKLDKEKTSEEQLDTYAMKFKHEIFFLNSFLKIHANFVSLMELYSGYNFSPFDFFSIESAFFWGLGFKDTDLSFINVNTSSFLVGQSAGIFLHLPLTIVEPSIGLRAEINYIILDHFYFTFPIDLGLKIYINQKHAIRINGIFQFIVLDINEVKWKNSYLIGFMVGYARKL